MSFLTRNVVRSGALSRRAALSSSRTVIASPSIRLMQTSAVRLADDHGHAPVIIQGEGAKPGEVPTDENQSTGLERFELLGRLQGVDVFDLKPLQADRLGTKKDPIQVQSLFPTRVVGCTGSPAGSHDTIWIHLNKDYEHHRCPECGSVYKLEFKGDESTAGGHH